MNGPRKTAPRAGRNAAAGAAAWLACGAAAPGALAQHADIDLLAVQGNVYMLHTAAGNITVQAGEDGILIVDSLSAERAPEIHAVIAPLSPKPIQLIVNTHAHAEHTGGNARLAQLGATILGGNVVTAVNEQSLRASARIIAHENVLLSMSSTRPARDSRDWPTDVFYTDRKDLYFNGEGVRILHRPAAHTDGDSIVYFRRSDVISAGDLFRTHEFPLIDRASGGSVQGVIDGLNAIIDIAVPAFLQEGGTMVIPGRGRLADESDVVEYRDMVVIVRDRIRDGIAKGLSLREVQAAQPTLGYDWQYGRSNPAWSGEHFVEAIYRELSAGE